MYWGLQHMNLRRKGWRRRAVYKYRYPLLFKNLLYDTSPLLKIYICTHFHYQKKFQEYLHFHEKKKKRWKVKTAFSICFAKSLYRGSAYPGQQEKLLPWEVLSTSSHHSFELHLWASVLYPNSFCAYIIYKVGPKATNCFFTWWHFSLRKAS